MLLIDASELVRKGRAQNFFDPEHAQQIANWVKEFTDVESKASVVDLVDVEAEDWTLSVSRYVQPPIDEIPPLEEAVADFRQVLQDAKAAEDNLRAVLTETGLIQ